MSVSRHPTLRPTVLRSSILGRLVMQAMLLTGFIVILLTTLSFLVTRSMLEQIILSQLSSIASVSEDAIEQTLQSHRERAALLSAHTDIRQILRSAAPRGTLERLFLQVRRDEPSLSGIEIYNADGRLLDNVGEGAGLPDDARTTPQYRSVTDSTGWRWYDVRTPVWGSQSGKIGYLTLRYDARPILDRFIAVAPSLGSGSQVLLARTGSGELQLFHLSDRTDASYILSLGPVTRANAAVMPWISSVTGGEGVVRSSDEKGADMLVAYRYLPTLGWGMALLIDRHTALAGVRTLAFTHAAIGTLLLLLAAILAWLLARQLTQPLRSLTERVQRLRPGAWAMHRFIHTGDEVEVLESVIVDMAGRLQKLYRSQEAEIHLRTEELRRQYALDRTILDNIGYGVLTVDHKGHIVGINPAGLMLLGERSDRIAGKPVQGILRICGHRGEALKSMHPLLQCMKTGKMQKTPLTAHFNIRLRDDTLLPILYTVSPFGTGNKIAGAVMVFQDVTEERKVDYLKTEFISLASHQLRTPLSALRWYVELMGEHRAHLDDDQRGYLREMEKSVARMVRLLTSLLHASRSESQKLQPSFIMTDLRTVLQEQADDTLPLLQEAALTCSLSLPKRAVTVRTDPTLLRIIMQNLLYNAIKYSRDAHKPIVIALAERSSDVTISVSDQGVGIPAAEQPRIFQKFFRAKNVRKLDTDGNGLGLYITKSIVERLGGTIGFQSAEGKGTTFTVTLPKGNPTSSRKAGLRGARKK